MQYLFPHRLAIRHGHTLDIGLLACSVSTASLKWQLASELLLLLMLLSLSMLDGCSVQCLKAARALPSPLNSEYLL